MYDFMSIFRKKEIPVIKYDEFFDLEPFKEIKLSEGVSAYRIPIHGDSHIAAFKYLKEGSEIEEHYHDCKEVVTVVSGSIKSRNKIYNEGDKFIIHKGVSHGFRALKESKIFIEFFKYRK